VRVKFPISIRLVQRYILLLDFNFLPMKRFIFISFVLASVCLRVASQQLVLEKTVIKLDTVEVKSRNVFDVTYRNTGDKPLVLKSVTTDCNCTKIKWNKAPLMPGESTAAQITFTPTAKGVFYKSVFFAPAGADSVKTLVIRGIVR